MATPYRSSLNIPAEAAADVGDAVGGDALDDVLRIRDHESNIVSVDDGTNEAARAKFVNLGVGSAVEVQSDAEAVLAGAIAPPEHWRIVAADLGTTGAVGGSAVELVEDQRPHGVRAVVHTGGQDVDAEGVFLGRAEAQLGAGAVDLRAHVHGGAGLVGRYVVGVEGDGGAHGIEEEVSGHGWAGYELGRVLHACGVLVGPEDLDLVRRCPERLQPLVGLLPVVQGRRHAVEPDVRVRHELKRRPLARRPGVVRLDVAIHWRGEAW